MDRVDQIPADVIPPEDLLAVRLGEIVSARDRAENENDRLERQNVALLAEIHHLRGDYPVTL